MTDVDPLVQCQLDHAAFQTGPLLDRRDGIVQPVQHLNDVLEKKAAVIIQRDLAALFALKEQNADLALQLGDGAAESGLGDVQLHGRLGKALIFGYGFKIGQLGDLHLSRLTF